MMIDRRPMHRCRQCTGKTAVGLLCAVIGIAMGCQQKMANQPAPRPLDASNFFADGQSARQLVAGTVARGHLRIDTHFETGRQQASEDHADERGKPANENPAAAVDDKAERRRLFGQPPFVESFPFEITPRFVEHGYHRYMIYCVVCHDPLGEGRGKIVERGYVKPPSYHEQRLRDAPVGRFFAVMTEGYGAMPSYSEQIPTEDRWAIAAYIRAVQLSQRFPAHDLTDEMKKEMTEGRVSEENENR